jgi:hypothetical protein
MQSLSVLLVCLGLKCSFHALCNQICFTQSIQILRILQIDTYFVVEEVSQRISITGAWMDYARCFVLCASIAYLTQNDHSFKVMGSRVKP